MINCNKLKVGIVVFLAFLFFSSNAYAMIGGLGNELTYGVALILILIIFLICREIVCWYWKINARIGLMEKMLIRLKSIDERIECISANRDILKEDVEDGRVDESA